MKSIKGFLSLLLALMLTLSIVFTGCAKKEGVVKVEESTTTAAAVEETTEAVVAEPLEPVELIWYLVGTPQPDQQLVFDAANKIIKEKINATVQFNIVDWGSYDDKMQVMLSTGEPIDLCFTSSWTNNYNQNVAKGAFLPLKDLLDQYAPVLKASVPESFWDATKVNGEIYGIVNQQVSALTKGFTFNETLVNKYNMDLSTIKEFKDIEPLLQTIKENEPADTIGLRLDSTNTGANFIQCVGSFDGIVSTKVPVVVKVSDSSMKVINLLDTQENTDLLYLLRDWYTKGYINQDAATVQTDDSKMKANQVLAATVGNIKPGGEAENSQRLGTTVLEVPVGETVFYTDSITGTMHAIPVSAKNPERAMMLMELLNTDKELFNLLAFGIEGTHFNKVGENRIEVIADSKYNPGIPWEIASAFNAYLLPGQADDVWEATKQVNANAIPSPLVGFNLDLTNIVSEVAQCSSVYDEFAVSLYTGSVDVDEILPKFKAKMESAGIQTVIDEVQKQVDAWKATK